MASNEFKQQTSEVMSYIALFAFIGVVAIGGYFVFRHFQQKEPVAQAAVSGAETDAQGPATVPVLPSTVLRQPMQESLPPVLGTYEPKVVEPPASLKSVESVIRNNAAQPSPLQPAWQIAGKICAEIVSTYKQRNQMVKKLEFARSTPKLEATKSSPLEAKLAQQKDEFFKRSENSRWQVTATAQKKRIEGLYAQLLAAEESARRQ